MKENVLEVLMYLFENYYIYGGDEEALDEASLTSELQRAGFQDGEITKALAWLESLTPGEGVARNPTGRSLRVYTAQEHQKLDVECRGFLLFMEQSGILDPAARELVIDRVMALEGDEIDLGRLKWIVLMVLFNQPGKEEAVAWIEDLVFDGAEGVRH